MKKIALLIFLGAAFGARAQGTIALDAHLVGTNHYGTNMTVTSLEAGFALNGNVLSYELLVPFSWGGPEIHMQDAVTGADKLLFSLRCTLTIIPFPPIDPGGCVFRDAIPLTEAEISGLLSGRWYVKAPTINPGLGDLTGQILPIPAALSDACPCDWPWRSREEYLHCVKDTASKFVDAGFITPRQERAAIKQAQRSHCGERTGDMFQSFVVPLKASGDALPSRLPRRARAQMTLGAGQNVYCSLEIPDTEFLEGPSRLFPYVATIQDSAGDTLLYLDPVFFSESRCRHCPVRLSYNSFAQASGPELYKAMVAGELYLEITDATLFVENIHQGIMGPILPQGKKELDRDAEEERSAH